MRLRMRLKDELALRLAAHLPEATATAWDAQSVIVAVEQLKFTSTGGVQDGWELRANFEGAVFAELRADQIDALTVESLIADLCVSPLHVNFAPETPEGALSERARAKLAELRDTVRDTQVVSRLRFTVSGTIARRVGPGVTPGELIVDGENLLEGAV